MNNTNPLVSIIVPVYKVERYIHRSIDSLLRQTYNNLEIILVDDGSPDNCPFICDKYAMQDNRIRVIHKSNGGLSDARNAALKNTITFMLTTAVEHTADVVQCRRKVDNAEGSGNVDVFQGVELTDHHDILDAFLCFQKNYKWTSTRRCK